MGPCSKFIIFPLVLFLSEASAAPLFREYIGAEFKGVRFSDVPINPNVEFHFILSFAADYDTSSSPAAATHGKFNVFWDTQNLSPSDVSAIKSKHSNVKVALSLGGDTVGGTSIYFNPASIDMWVSNSVASLTSIIQQYNLDGIDVNYENFIQGSDPNMFSQCIGQLVTALKNNGVISFASIAPYDNSDVQRNYMALWKDYGSVIDYVNFQFYAYSSSTTVSQFQSYFNKQANNYGGGKVLVSFNSAANAGGLTPSNGFFKACSILQRHGELHGIFVWSADDSKDNRFRYERQAQTTLAGSH